MTKTRFVCLTAVLGLALASSACSSKKDEAKPTDEAAKPADPTAQPETAKQPEAKPEEPAKTAAAGDAPIDPGGFQLNAVPGQSLVGGDGVAQFSGSFGANECQQYATKLVPILEPFGKDMQRLAPQFGIDAAGVNAMREAARICLDTANKMAAIAPSGGGELATAHNEVTSSIRDMGEGLNQFASAVQSNDSSASDAAMSRVGSATQRFQTGIQNLLRLCGA